MDKDSSTNVGTLSSEFGKSHTAITPGMEVEVTTKCV